MALIKPHTFNDLVNTKHLEFPQIGKGPWKALPREVQTNESLIEYANAWQHFFYYKNPSYPIDCVYLVVCGNGDIVSLDLALEGNSYQEIQQSTFDNASSIYEFLLASKAQRYAFLTEVWSSTSSDYAHRPSLDPHRTERTVLNIVDAQGNGLCRSYEMLRSNGSVVELLELESAINTRSNRRYWFSDLFVKPTPASAPAPLSPNFSAVVMHI